MHLFSSWKWTDVSFGKPAEVKQLKRDLWWNRLSNTFSCFIFLISRSSLHGGLFNFGCIISTKGCSLPMPNLREVSIFPFHVVMGNPFFFLSFPGNFCTCHKLWKADFREKKDEHLRGVIIPKSKLYYFFFLLFYRVSRPSDVIIKKKKKRIEKYATTEFRITV